MLKHYVLFRFEKDFFQKENLKEFQTVFAEVEKDCEGVLSARVYTNCVERPANMDLMIEMELSGEDQLPVYLNHPLHLAMGARYNPHIVDRKSFDYEI